MNDDIPQLTLVPVDTRAHPGLVFPGIYKMVFADSVNRDYHNTDISISKTKKTYTCHAHLEVIDVIDIHGNAPDDKDMWVGYWQRIWFPFRTLDSNAFPEYISSFSRPFIENFSDLDANICADIPEKYGFVCKDKYYEFPEKFPFCKSAVVELDYNDEGYLKPVSINGTLISEEE